MEQTEETQAVEQTTKKYEASELQLVLQTMSKCKNDKDLKSSSTTLSGIRISRQVNKILKEQFELQEEVMKAYGVKIVQKPTGAVYDYEGHPEIEKIKSALKELESTKYEVQGFNAIDEEEFIIFTRGLTQGEVAFLAEYLMI